MVVERVVRFGEGTVVIGTCKKPAWTLMMSCGTWNERESKCVLSMRVVSFFEWGRVLYYTGHRYLPCRYWCVAVRLRLLVEDRMGGPPWSGVPWGPYPLQVMVFSEH